MKLILSLSVLAVALLMVLEGPAPAQADSGIMEDMKAIWSNVKDKVQGVFERIDWKWFSDTFSGPKESTERTVS